MIDQNFIILFTLFVYCNNISIKQLNNEQFYIMFIIFCSYYDLANYM